jgi:O-antigen/teichoic acid export membrane protein
MDSDAGDPELVAAASEGVAQGSPTADGVNGSSADAPGAPADTALPADRSAPAAGSSSVETISDEQPAPLAAATASENGDGEDGGAGSRGELRSAARGGVAFTVGIFVSLILQIGFLKLLTHSLDQSDVGALLEAVAIFTICNNTAELGADTGLLRFSPIFYKRRPQDIRRLHVVALAPALVASTLAAVLLFIFSPQLVHVFVHHTVHKGAATSLRILACFLPAVTLTTVICAGLRAWTTRAVVIINSFLVAIARPVIFAAFLVLGVTLKLATIAYAIPTAAAFVAAAIVLAAKFRGTVIDRDAPVAPYGEIASQFWRFSLPRTFGAILQILLLSFDVLLVGAFLSARDAAAYSVASRYALYATFALQAIVASVVPQLSRLMDALDYSSVRIVYKSSTWWTIIASWPALLVLAVFAPFLLSLFGHGYVIASSALTVLSLAMLVSTGTGPSGPLLQMAGRSGVVLAIQGISLVLNLGLDIWLIPRIGLVGAALGWLASILISQLAISGVIWRNFGVQPFGSGYWITGGAALGCYGVLGLATRLAFGATAVAFVSYAIVSSVLYAVVLFRWRKTLQFDAFESLYGGIFRRARRMRASIAGTKPS